jgi:hypothetical protein
MRSHTPALRAIIVAWLGTAALVVGCRQEAAAPIRAPFAGTYALEWLNGSPLPALAAEGAGQRYFVLADTLAFSPEGTVARRLTVRHIDATATPPEETVYRHRLVFPYTVDDGHLTIGFREVCPPNANCIGFEEGTVSAANAVVIGRIFWPGEPILMFRRVPNE